jgi:hypothetical protein
MALDNYNHKHIIIEPVGFYHYWGVICFSCVICPLGRHLPCGCQILLLKADSFQLPSNPFMLKRQDAWKLGCCYPYIAVSCP